MADKITMQWAAFGGDRRAITEDVAAIRRQVERLYADLAELNAMWDGPANAAFAAQFTTDHTAMRQLCGELATFAESLDYANSQYASCEEKVRQAVQAIRL